MRKKFKAYSDLLRLHFFFVWPTLFCAGLFLGFTFHGGFNLVLIIQAVFIAFLGFEAGLVLNDINDANLDKKELPTEKKLTQYWRPFGRRPLPSNQIYLRHAKGLFVILAALTSIIIFTLPYPHSIYVFTIMITCYCLEVFYQIKKRKQKTPIAQIIGRIDFALFLAAGYLCVGIPDLPFLLLLFFFYPLALAHLGVNDLVDVVNDQAKAMKTPATLYGIKATGYWILLFSTLHFIATGIFLYILGSYLMLFGFMIGILLVIVGNLIILKNRSSASGIKALPFFHLSMLIYAITIITNYIVIAFL